MPFICFCLILFIGQLGNAGIQAPANGSINRLTQDHQQKYAVQFNTDATGHVIQNENSVSFNYGPSQTTVKTIFENFDLVAKIRQQLNATSFFQYNFYSSYLISRLQKTDLIFPHHHFW